MSLRKSDIASALSEEAGSTFEIGECVLIRTVSYTATGRIQRISNLGDNFFIHLEDAAYIADTERWTDCIEKGAVTEVEPVSSILRVHVGSIVDVWCWNTPLPRTQK